MPFSTYDILIALDVQSRGGGVLGVLQRDLASAATGVRNLGAAMSDTTRLAQQAASAQNALVAATSRLAAEQRLQQSRLVGPVLLKQVIDLGQDVGRLTLDVLTRVL